MELICPQGTPELQSWTLGDGPPCPTIVLERDALKQVHRSIRPIFRFDTGSTVIVRIDRTAGGKSTDNPLACGPVTAGALYVLTDNTTLAAGNILRITIFDLPRETETSREQKLAKQRETALATPAYAEEEVAERAQLADLRQALWTTQRSDPAEATQGAQKSLDKARERLDEVRTNSCASVKAPLDQAICGAATKYASALRTIDSKFKDVHGVRGSPLADQEIALRQAVEALPKAMDDDALHAHCETASRIEWWRGEHWRAVSRHEVPILGPDDRVETVTYGLGETSLSDLWSSQYLGAMLLDAPNGESITVSSQRAVVVSQSPAEVFGRFLGVVTNLPGVIGLSALIPEFEISLPEPLSPLCKERGFLGPFLDGEAETLAQQTTRAIALGPSSGDYHNEISICAGDKCSDDSRRNKLVVTSHSDWGAVLLVEQSFNGLMGFGGNHLSRAQFEAVGGATGPDQMYQLTYTLDPRDLFATSVLFGGHWRRFGAAFGPAFLIGPRFSPLSQWSLRVTFEITRGLLVTPGLGIRLVPTAVDWSEGAIVAVPRPSSGDVAPPSLRTAELAQWVYGVGIAVDLGALADGGAGLLKGIGASK